MKRNLRDLKKDLQTLSLPQLQQINVWVQQLIMMGEDKAQRLSEGSKANIVLAFNQDGKTYRLEYIRCGNAECKCASGSLHGPYWYAYWYENGKTKSSYIGKELKLQRVHSSEVNHIQESIEE